MTEYHPTSAVCNDNEAAARRRHPTAIWVPDVDEIRRRIARQTSARHTLARHTLARHTEGVPEGR